MFDNELLLLLCICDNHNYKSHQQKTHSTAPAFTCQKQAFILTTNVSKTSQEQPWKHLSSSDVGDKVPWSDYPV